MGANRQRRMNPKKGLFWCGSCDMAMLGDGNRCPNCGQQDPRKRLKKRGRAVPTIEEYLKE